MDWFVDAVLATVIAIMIALWLIFTWEVLANAGLVPPLPREWWTKEPDEQATDTRVTYVQDATWREKGHG